LNQTNPKLKGIFKRRSSLDRFNRRYHRRRSNHAGRAKHGRRLLMKMNASRAHRVRNAVLTAAAVGAALLLAGCEKSGTPATQADTAASAATDAANHAAHALDQVASAVDQQINAAKSGLASAASAVPALSASGLASAAQAQIDAAASAVVAHAASEAGAKLAEAGKKLQQWSQQKATGAKPASGE
jgi:hypothetical protein